jgi:hypothetical protein
VAFDMDVRFSSSFYRERTIEKKKKTKKEKKKKRKTKVPQKPQKI